MVVNYSKVYFRMFLKDKTGERKSPVLVTAKGNLHLFIDDNWCLWKGNHPSKRSLFEGTVIILKAVYRNIQPSIARRHTSNALFIQVSVYVMHLPDN